MGISFKDDQMAKKCQSILQPLKLTDGREVNLQSHITLQTDFDLKPDYILEIFPENMVIDGNRKNLEYPFFGEIRKQLLEFVKKLDLNFNIAFCECEGADRVAHENIINWINQSGIGQIRAIEENDIYFDSRNYIPKRYFDGLVLSNEEYNRLHIKYKEFEIFKEGYMWLPI